MKTNTSLILLFGGFVTVASLTSLDHPRTSHPVSAAATVTLEDTCEAPHIQVVFALDATGSMSGLIGAAKEKIWSIAGSLSQSTPAPKLEMGIVFYRDKGDAFVTKIIALSLELDDMYDKLMDIKAEGGGDGPESVNQGLYDAVNRINWSTDPKTIKNLFLVGDFPPHMDYKDDVKYMETCKEAKKKGITINTILMGNNSETRKIWQEISSCSDGEFMEMNMAVNNFEIDSPYDKEIEELQRKLDGQRLYYGNETDMAKNESKKIQAEKFYIDATESTNARRAECNMSNGLAKDNYYGSKELFNDISDKRVKLEDLKENELPETLRKMTTEERKKYVEEKLAEREKLEKELTDLTKKRQEYLQTELTKMDSSKVESSFNNVIYEKVQKQAKSKGYKMEGRAKF